MVKSIEIKVFPDKAIDTDYHRAMIEKQLKSHVSEITDVILVRRSIDARGSRPIFLLKYDVYIGEAYMPESKIIDNLRWDLDMIVAN